MNITEKLRGYYDNRGKHDRDRSWEFCYRFFHSAGPEGTTANRDRAALQLGFYLASWGMYRNSFLLHYAYTVHLDVVACLLEPKFSKLWTEEFGATDSDADLVPLILAACEDVRTAYRPFAEARDKLVTDTLVTKVVLGTMGCFPALDTYFNAGSKHQGISVPDRLNSAFIQNMFRFCRDNLREFQDEQANIEEKYKMYCPLMKLVDAYFHQIGWELAKEDLKQRLARYKRIKIRVEAATPGRTLSTSVWFVQDSEKVYLLPLKGSRTQWYRELIQNPLVRIDARGIEAEFQATHIADANAVKTVVEKFREKYGAKDVEKNQSNFDVAVVAEAG